MGNSASKEERERWQLLVRAGRTSYPHTNLLFFLMGAESLGAVSGAKQLRSPQLLHTFLEFTVLICWAAPLLATISRYLGSESGREEGKEKLFNLCDDGIVSRTIRGPPIPCRSQTSTSIAHREDQADTGTERTETRRAISQLNQISPPSTGSPESFQRSRTTGRPSSIAERSHVPSRTQSTGSPISARTTSRPTTIRQARPPSSRPAESGRPTVRPPLPSGSRPSAHFHARPPTGVAIRDFAVGADNETAQPARPLPPNQIAAPADASPQTALYMAGRGTASPTYISPSKFFAEHGEEHGLERPPAYATEAPSTPAAAQFIPRQRAGEDLEAMTMEGRHGMWRMRSTHAPSSIPRAQNGIGGGEAERN